MEDNDQLEPAEMDAPGPLEEHDGPSPRAEAEGEAGDGDGVADFCAALADDLAASLSTLLRTPVTVHTRGAERCDWAQFRRSVSELTCCFPLAGDDGRAAAWVEIPAALAFAFCARMLGGAGGAEGGEREIPDRPLTPIERRVLGRVVDTVATCLATASPQLRRPDGQADTTAPPPDEPAAVLRLSVSMQPHAEPLRICLLCRDLPGELRPAADTAGQYHAIQVPAASGETPLELSVALDECAIDPDELAGLSRGDILVTDADADGEVIVRVAGIPKFIARLGTTEGKRVVKITRRLDQPTEGESAWTPC